MTASPICACFYDSRGFFLGLLRVSGVSCMKKWKTRVFYAGGSIPVPSYLQKGTIEIRDGAFCFRAGKKIEKHTIDIRIPLTDIKRVIPVEKKFYSSVGYFLHVDYLGDKGREESIELEIRCFIRRGRTQALMHLWVEMLGQKQ